MKYISIIFAVFILAISIIPCVDVHSANETNVEITEKQHSEDNHNDDCSPFCICDCCSISVINLIFENINEEKLEENSLVYFHYSFDYSFSFQNNVWNPPKV